MNGQSKNQWLKSKEYKTILPYIINGEYSTRRISEMTGYNIYKITKVLAVYLGDLKSKKIPYYIADDRVPTSELDEEDFNYELGDLPEIRFENLCNTETEKANRSTLEYLETANIGTQTNV